MIPCRQSVQDALDDIGGMAGIECPACGNDADWRVDAVNAAGSALMTCGACGKAGTISPNTVQRLHLQHSRILGRIERIYARWRKQSRLSKGFTHEA